jgi:hypothetical protein
VLKNWPEGYRMFDHHKGKADAPRHDVYLFGESHTIFLSFLSATVYDGFEGPPKARFRSVPEFIPHAIWLMEDPTLDPSNCKCKYCSKKPQRDITSSMANILRSTPGTQSPGPRSRREMGSHKGGDLLSKVRERPRERKVFAAVQRVPKPLKPSSKITKYSMLRERNSDLRAVNCTTGMTLKRWFREGELLWCALDPPIPGRSGDIDSINFWPGLVDEVRLKSEAIPRSTSVNSASASGHGFPNGSSDHINVTGQDAMDEDGGDSTPWSVRQSTVYKMRLLAVSHTYFVSDDKVLPYQAYAPPIDLIQALQEYPPDDLDLNPERMRTFNPCPQLTPNTDASPARFGDAVSPYAVALQIGAKLSGYWCLTDDWDFKYTVQPVARPVSSSAPSSLQSAIIAAGSNNASLHDAGSNGPSQYHQTVSGPSNNMSQAEVQQIANRTLGPPPQVSQTITQTRYQGLWWGGERIWTDEFIRLKVPRRCLAPRGAENIYPPSGPGKSVLEKWGSDLGQVGAGARGVFMRLDGLFVVDIPQQDGGTKKECRASGMLYELADEDWEDPQEAKSQNAATNGIPSTSSQQQPPANGGPSFMPGPLPLKPSPLPNFDPSIPIASTSPAVLAQTLPPNSLTSHTLPNSQLSSPTSTPYLLPPPPVGYKFRPILPPGHESVMSLSLLSGRYYPRLLSHPLLEPVLRQAMSNPQDDGGLMENNHLWALEGLSAGFYNSVDPTKSKGSRGAMMRDADEEARAELETHVQAMKQQKVDAQSADELMWDQPSKQMDVDVGP